VEGQQAPVELSELSNEQWSLWLHHPITKVVLQRYLPDFRAALERQTLNAWTGGTLSLQAEQEARGYLLSIFLVENLSLDQVRTFYGMDSYADELQRRRRV
jgi:hypothetical protein